MTFAFTFRIVASRTKSGPNYSLLFVPKIQIPLHEILKELHTYLEGWSAVLKLDLLLAL